MPYILIEKRTGFAEAISEVEIITTPRMYLKILEEEDFLSNLRVYIMRAATNRKKLGADSKEAKREKIKKCCDRVEGCTRAFHALVMDRELIENNSLN